MHAKALQASLNWLPPGALIAGVDEAGRGPLAGPVFAAAVILDDLQPIAGLNDSKKLSAARRQALAEQIRARALCCCVAQASVEEIAQLNILGATLLAMRRAVLGLRLKPALVQIDGNRLPRLDVPMEAIVGGDAKVAAISAASILAKVARDAWCDEAHALYPQYGFAAHKGYGTAAHLQALAACGPCALHRMDFKPVAEAAAAHSLRGEPVASSELEPLPSAPTVRASKPRKNRASGDDGGFGF